MREAGDGPHGLRLRALIVVLWRTGLRISESQYRSMPVVAQMSNGGAQRIVNFLESEKGRR